MQMFDTPTDDYNAYVISYALSGNNLPKTILFKGSINNKTDTILVDFRSTHNFVQSRLARYPNLTC